jgi:hypothetical protein
MDSHVEYKKSLAQAQFNLSMRLPIEDKSVAARLDRAVEIMRNLGSGYDIKPVTHPMGFPIHWDVYKESTSLLEDNSVHYRVDGNGCSCPDASGKARAGLCKHRLAVMLIEEMCTE